MEGGQVDTWETFASELHNAFIFGLSLLLLVTLSSFMLITTILIYIWKRVLTVILTYKYGDDFGGLLNAFDGAFAIPDLSSSIINSVVTHESELKVPEFVSAVKRQVYEKCFKHPERFPKFLHVRESFGGSYFLKKCGRYEEAVRVFNCKTEKSSITEDDLLKIIPQIYAEGLPKNSTSFFEVVVVDKPVETICGRSFKNPVYVTVFRMHHSLGDGFALAKFFFYDFSINHSATELSFSTIVGNKNSTQTATVSQSKTGLSAFYQIIKDIPEYLSKQQNVKTEKNFFYRKDLSGDKIVVYAIEPEQRLVEFVKEIKNHYPGTTFSDVVLTAISASFSEYFDEEIEDSEFFPAYVPVPHNIKNSDKTELSNNFVNTLYRIPMISHKSMSLEARLDCVKAEAAQIKNSMEKTASYWLIKFVSFLPRPIVVPFMKSVTDYMSVISILPGTEKDLCYFEKSRIIDMNVFLPTVKNLGVSMVIVTNNGRFQMTLVVDKSLIPDQEKAKLVLDGIFKYIEKLRDNIKN